MNENMQEEKKKEEERKKNSTGKKEEMKGKGRKEIKTVGREKQGKETKGNRKKNRMKKRLVTCSLNNYATQHLTLNACNCQLFKSDLQPASWLT